MADPPLFLGFPCAHALFIIFIFAFKNFVLYLYEQNTKQIMDYHKYLVEVAKRTADFYGHDYYEALNVAECIVQSTDNIVRDSQRVHAVLEGEY